ncbi:MAG TPA: ABC transporter ATP-binding protein/permease [Firmicutes bacterium]|nr:ABC transporter ATP-binding protein/permease [Bacillota bacterium]
MKKLAFYLREYRKESVLGPLFKLLEAFFDLLVPLVVAYIIDYGIGEKRTDRIGWMCALLVGLALVGLACSITAQFFAAKASVGCATRLRHALFAHIQRFAYEDLDRVGGSTLITRLTSDINQVQNGLNLALRLLLRSPFVVFGSMVMAFTIDVPSALIFAVAIPVLCVVVFGIMLLSIPLYRKVQAGLDRIVNTTRENLTGVRVIRAFCKEENEKEEFGRQNEALTAMQKFVGRLSALMNPVTYVIINAATIWLIWKGAVQVDSGALTQGSVVALYNYMAQILTELIKMASLIISITKAVACAQRVEKVLDTEPSMEAPSASSSAAPNNAAPMVSFHDVSMTYPGAGAPSLSHVSFSAWPGETIGITGGTGSGKSTLVNLIPRFYDATDGQVEILGQNVKDLPLSHLRDTIGVVPQKAVLFAGSIRENMQWGKKDAGDEDIYKALDIAQAREIVEKKEGGLDFEVEQGGRNLSGGQRQRLTIARALLRDPSILILDDSASALDFATDAALREALRTLRGSSTVFLVSQRTMSLRSADRILVLDDGELVGSGTHEELLKTCRVYQEIHYSQFPEERPEGWQDTLSPAPVSAVKGGHAV